MVLNAVGVPDLEAACVAHDHDFLVDADGGAHFRGQHDAPRGVHLDIAGAALQHAAKLDVLAVGLLVLAEPIDEQLLDPFVEIGRLEHVHALVGQLRRHHEIFGKNLAELRGKGHATFAVNLEMELAVEIYPMLGQLACPFGVGGGGHVFLSVLRFEGDLISFGVRFEIPLGRFPQHAYYPTMPHFATFSPTFALFSPHLSSSRYGRVTEGKCEHFPYLVFVLRYCAQWPLDMPDSCGWWGAVGRATAHVPPVNEI